MEKKFFSFLILCYAICFFLSGCAGTIGNSSGDTVAAQDVLYQVSTLDALMQGVYDGEITLDKLLEHGDFGIGTFEGLDGEMVILDGTVYQVLSSGEVVRVNHSDKTPFAMITYFDTDIQSNVRDITDYSQLKAHIDTLLPSQNMFYAIKIEGTFTDLKARSVPAQAEPYPLLADVTCDQTVFEFHEVKGSLVGYWCPAYIDGVNLSGYHLHFISEDHSIGGHLLDCSIKEGVISIDTTTAFHMLLPENEHFEQTDLSGVSNEEKQAVEQ